MYYMKHNCQKYLPYSKNVKYEYWYVCLFVLSQQWNFNFDSFTCIYIYMFLYVNIHEYIIQSLSHVLQLRSHGLQCTLFPYPLLFPGVCSNSCPLSRWRHPIISFSVTLFSSCSVFPSIRVFSNKLTLLIRWWKN